MALLKDFGKVKCPVLLYLPENEERFSLRNSNFVLQLETVNYVKEDPGRKTSQHGFYVSGLFWTVNKGFYGWYFVKMF